MLVKQDRLIKLLQYDIESGNFYWRSDRNGGSYAGDVAGTPHPEGYIYIRVDGKKYKAHRLAWFYVTGKWPDGEIDHKNGIKDDNRFCNIRDVSHRDNMHNMLPVRGEINFCGVSRSQKGCAKPYRARITVDGVQVFLGNFDSTEEARDAYLSAKKQLHVAWGQSC